MLFVLRHEFLYRNNRIGYLGAQRISPGIAKNTSLETLKVGINFSLEYSFNN